MAVLPDRDAAQRIAAFLEEHAGWSAFWDKRSGVWRVSEDDPSSELYAEDADAGWVIDYMRATAGDIWAGEEAASAETSVASAAEEIDLRLIAFMLPGIPGSVPVARFHVRAALTFHDLGQFADDATVITSELVTNAVQHACRDVTETIGGDPRVGRRSRGGDRRRIGLLAPRPGAAHCAARQRTRPGAPDRGVAVCSLGLAP